MIFADTHDMVAQLADDLDVSPAVATSVLDSLLCDADDD
jgi:hypothetical protein